MGKSLFVAHMVDSLLNQKPFLGREVSKNQHKIAWMGFDSLWISELAERVPHHDNRLFIGNSISYTETENWKTFNNELRSEGISLLVIDHLYGLAESLDLNNHNEVEMAMKPLMQIVNLSKIPVLLIAHGNKNGTGRAAHSVAIEGKARHLLRLSNSTGQLKLLKVKGNRYGDESLKFHLDLNRCELSVNEPKKVRERTDVSIVNAKRLLNDATPDDRLNISSAGRWYYQEGISSTAQAGRTLVGRLIKKELLSRPSDLIPFIYEGIKLK